MNNTKRLNGSCRECGAPIEFAAEAIGTTAQCPRCRKPTELLLATPPSEPLVPRKVMVWTVVTCAVLILGAVAVVLGLKHFETLAVQKKHQSGSAAAGLPAGLQVSAISVSKDPADSESYAVGTVENTSRIRRLGLAAQLDLLDAAGQKVGIGRAYRPSLEPGAKWEFKVATTDARVFSAKLASLKEGQ